MHSFLKFAGLASLPSLIFADEHFFHGFPRAFGISQLKHRELFGRSLVGPQQENHSRKDKRQSGNTSGQCGSGYGSCAAGYCCSSSGWCGQGSQYCAAPDCQFNYGPGCDANQAPTGPSTANVPRSLTNQAIAYGGAGVYRCTVPGTVAITYDDGPISYTSYVLDLFDKYNAKGTFFITGNNLGKGMIDVSWSSVIQRMYNSGHQLASHTWSHQDLSTLTTQQLHNQMLYLETSFVNIVGMFPQYMRPPYSSCNAACQTVLGQLGYHIIYFNLDTEDYLHDDPNLIQLSKNDVTGNLSTGNNPTADSWLSVSHDIHYQTVYNLTEFMLQTFTSAGFKMVTVGDCLGDPVANWYRHLNDTATNTTSSAATGSTAVVSSDGSCGGTGKQTCLGSGFGNCCSGSGYCGSTSDYCGTGCQTGFGTCTASNSTTATATGASTAASAGSSGGSSAGVSTDGSCGGSKGLTCAGSSFGNCCSQYGYCGSDTAHCGAGCNTLYGTCSGGSGTNTATQASTAASGKSTSSNAGGASGNTSASSTASGNSSGTSTTTTKASSTTNTATTKPSSTTTKTTTTKTTKPTSTTAKSTTPSAASKVSSDGTCGPLYGNTCQGSTYGNCCSQYGYCGSDTAHCGDGCNSLYGTCGASGTTAGTSSTSAALVASKDGSCGGTTGYTCKSSVFGLCCSAYGWCGSDTAHCSTINGCQTKYGVCI